MKWFDRKFSFDFLEGTYNGILERLQDTPLRLQYKIGNIPTENYRQNIDGAWSIQEQVGHLADLEALWIARFEDFIAGKEVLTEADLTNRKTHAAGHNQKEMEQLLDSFKSQREHLCTLLLSVSGNAEKWRARHPRLNTPMRPIDLAYFIAEHDDHHLAKITGINRFLGDR